MAEDRLPISCNERERLPTRTCSCVVIGADNLNLKRYDTYINKIRPFFVSTLECRIHALLERFIYGEDADRFHEQFPCLKKCIDRAMRLSVPVNEHCSKCTGREMLKNAIKGTMKYLVREGLFNAFINSVVLNNRINRICRELDALGIEKTCLSHLNVWNFVCEKDYWIVNPQVFSFNSPTGQVDDLLSDLTVEVGTDLQENLPFRDLKRKASVGSNQENQWDDCSSSATKIRRTSSQEFSTSSSSCSRKSRAEYLKIRVSKLQFASCGCVGEISSRRFGRLKLPCKSEDVIRKIFKIDKTLPHSCLTAIRRRFEQAVHKVCSCLNDILSRVDRRAVKELFLACEIRPGYVSFKLKSLGDSKPCLFSARVATCRSASKRERNFERPINREVEKLNLSEIRRVDSYPHYLSDVQEEDEDVSESDPCDGEMKENQCRKSEPCRPDPEDVPRSPSDQKFQVLQTSSESIEFQAPKISCDQVSDTSRSGFLKIELKLREVAECFKKSGFASPDESAICQEKKVDVSSLQGLELGNLQEKEELRGIKRNETSSSVLEQLDELNESSALKVEVENHPEDSEDMEEDSKSLQEGSESYQAFQRGLKGIQKDLEDIGKEMEGRWKDLDGILEDSDDLQANEESKNEVKNNEEFSKNEPEVPSNCLRVPGRIRQDKSQIPRPICSKICPGKKSESEIREEANNAIPGSVSNSRRESSPGRRKSEGSSRIPVLKEKLSLISVDQPKQSSSFGRNCSTPSSSVKLASRLSSSTSRKRAVDSSKQVGSMSRCKLTNPADESSSLIKSLASTATPAQSSRQVPQPAKRVFMHRKPSSKGQQTSSDLRQSTCSREEANLKDVYRRNEETPRTTYVIVTDSEVTLDQCDSTCPCGRENYILKNFPPVCSCQPAWKPKPSKDSCSVEASSLDRIIQKLEVCPFKSCCLLKLDEGGKSKDPEIRASLYNQNRCTVSVQTVEHQVSSKGINIDIREVRQTLSKGVNVNGSEAGTKNLNISRDSFISLQTNVTKIISIVDITIFEGERCECPSREIPRRVNEEVNEGLMKTRRGCPASNGFQPRVLDDSSPRCYPGKERMKVYPSSPDLPRPKGFPRSRVKPCEARRCRRGTGDAWLCPKRTTRAQNVLNAFCEPFAHKSINRIKYLIRTKLCKMLLHREGSSGSKSFISSERFYVSASSEKTSCSPGGTTFSSRSSRSDDSDFCSREMRRLKGGSDNPLFKFPERNGSISNGSGRAFDGGERSLMIKRSRSVRGSYLRRPGEELRPSEEQLQRTISKKLSKRDLSTSKEDWTAYRSKNPSSSWNTDCLDSLEDSRELGINQNRHVKLFKKREGLNRATDRRTSPGEVITSCHLGRRKDEPLRKMGQSIWSCCESDKENGPRDPSRTFRDQSNFGKERGQSSSRRLSRSEGKNRSVFETRGIDESFCDLEQSVQSRLKDYMNFCKSAKYTLLEGSDIYGVSSTSIPCRDMSDAR